MAKSDKDYVEKVKKRLEDIKFKTPSRSKDPKFVQKQLKNLEVKSPKKMKNKKDKKAFLKAVVAKLNN